MNKHEERISKNPYGRVFLAQNFVQQSMVAYENQSRISMFSLWIVLQDMVLNQVFVTESNVFSLFGHLSQWHDSRLDSNRPYILQGHEISIAPDHLDNICSSIGLPSRKDSESEKKGLENLKKYVTEKLGWKKINS